MSYRNISWKIRVGLKTMFIFCFKKATFIPDRVYVKLLYFLIFFRWPNLKNPRTFNEHITKLKLKKERISYSVYTDKYLVRDYVSSQIGAEYLIELYGVYDNFSDIDFENLPAKCVIKTTHGSGYNYIPDKNKKISKNELNSYFSKSLLKNYYYNGRELNYKNIQPRIIVEKLLEPHDGRLFEFKIFCFHGYPKFIQLNNYNNGKRYSNIYDTSWNKLDLVYGYPNFIMEYKPLELEKLLYLAKSLSTPFDFVRVDLYLANNQIYFSELTFQPGGGLIPFQPKSYDLLFGSYFAKPSQE